MNNEDIVSLMERYKRELLEFEKRNTAPVSAQEKAESEPVSAQQMRRGRVRTPMPLRGGRAAAGTGEHWLVSMTSCAAHNKRGERRGGSYNSAADRRSEGESDAV